MLSSSYGMREGISTLAVLGTGLAVCNMALGAPPNAPVVFRSTQPDATGPTGLPVQVNRIAVIPVAGDKLLSTTHGLDLDHDGLREFIIGPETGEKEPFFLYECTTDNTFVLAHVLDVENSANGNDSYYPADAGDIDGDGLADLVVRAKDWVAAGLNEYGIFVYESASTDTYPTEPVWEDLLLGSGWWFGGRIVDGDLDGTQEIVAAQKQVGSDFVVYENDGDDSYAQIHSEPVPGCGCGTGQSFGVSSDLDGDGRPEMVYGEVNKITAFESTGDNTYASIWAWTFNPTINVQVIVDGGDLDGDGKKELLAGGLRPNVFTHLLHVFEPVGDNEVEIVTTLTLPPSGGEDNFYTSANVADVDGDGRREIVFATGNTVKIYKNVGDNAWQQIWTGAGNFIQEIGAGDHDQDGKDEIIFRGGSAANGSTGVWEIDPAYQADLDGDDRVDAIDNCPEDFNPGQEDADADAVGDACDNCLHGPNPDQGSAPLGQMIQATDEETFSWSAPADVLYVRGALSGVNGYAIDLLDALALATSLTDAEVPPPGAGSWYLVRPDCPVGSWQSTIGAEPARDAALP